MAQLFGLARLGRDAEIRYVTSGEAVASLSLAFNYGKKGGDGKRPTQWVEGSLWGKLAEALSPYLTKGGQVAVTLDDLHIEEYKKSDGSSAVKLVGRVSSIELGSSADRQERAPAPAPAPAPAARRAPPPPPTTGFDNMDDDIPF